jgi:hypothetical protein
VDQRVDFGLGLVDRQKNKHLRPVPVKMTPPTTPTASNSEGVIKFALEFTPEPLGDYAFIDELNAWRTILFRLGLTGQDPCRYGGLAFGNLSHIVGLRQFIISGTQTGGKENLTPGDYCLVVDFDVTNNQLKAQGPLPPSSEALTHGAIYAANPQAECVIHVHSPQIWRHAEALGIQCTHKSIAYGTPEMAQALAESAQNHAGPGIIAMRGHEDGVIAFAAKIKQAGCLLLECLAAAYEREHKLK